MKALRERLAEAGIKKAFLDKVVLPEWWDDEIASSRAGFLEGAGYISARLGYSLASLTDDDATLLHTAHAGVKYKKNAAKDEDDVQVATHCALGVARAVAAAWHDAPPASALPPPDELRGRLLSESDQPWITLPQLLETAWKAGIPVLPLCNLPPGAKKPDALTTMVGDRPVIVVLSGRKSPSWLAFIVAHELGHIFRRHLKPGHTLVDEKIDAASCDAEEREANGYGLQLITGHGSLKLVSTGSALTIPVLAEAAGRFGREHRMAPGVAALNYGFVNNRWPVAVGAVSQLERGEDASAQLRTAMLDHLREDDFSHEAWDWVVRATNAGT